MANKKVSELVAITSDAVASTDVLPIVDVSATATKKITKAELAEAIGISNTPVDLTGLADTDVLAYSSTNTRFEPAASLPISPGVPAVNEVLAYGGSTYAPVNAMSVLTLDANVCWVGGVIGDIGASGKVTNQSAGATVTLGQAYVFPVTFTKAAALTLGVRLSSTSGSANIRIAIYSDNPTVSGPGTRLFHEQIVGSTSAPFTAGTFTPTPGVKYWAYIRNDDVQVSFLIQSFPPFQLIGSNNSSFMYWSSQSGDPPATIDAAGTSGGNNGTHPCLYNTRAS